MHHDWKGRGPLEDHVSGTHEPSLMVGRSRVASNRGHPLKKPNFNLEGFGKVI